MSAFLTLDSLSLVTPDGAALTPELTLAFGWERTGLVGRNGSGKTSLLALMAGESNPSIGAIHRSGSVALLHQHWPDDGVSAAAALGVADGLSRLHRLLAGDGSGEDAAQVDWTLEERVEEALAGVGLPPDILVRPIGSFSGGERTRLAIARIRIEAPDLLLLDEPTNNLDRDGQQLISELVHGWKGGVVVASHDRALLEHMDRIVELSPAGATVFGGNWSAWKEARDEARERAREDLVRAERDVRRVERSVQQQRERKAQRDKAGRLAQRKRSNSKLLLDAKQDRSERTAGRDSDLAERMRLAAQADLEGARTRIAQVTPLRIALPPSGLRSNRTLLRCDAVELFRGGRPLFRPLSFEINGAERIVLTGPNGAGKTSLLDLVRGAATPDRGSLWALRERMALLDQHVGMLDPTASLIENMRRLHPRLSPHDAHAALARFAFRNRAAMRLAGTLSGGERLRAGLACILSGPETPQLLLLDEPTNHLDMESIEILEEALAGYDGALLVASHDEAFLQKLVLTREIALVRP